MKKLSLVVFLLAFCLVSVGIAAEKSFKASLSGGDVVPAVKTEAKGDAEFKLSGDGSKMSFKIDVKSLENATSAHIHQGKKGQSGPPVVMLFTGPKKAGKFSGTLAKGDITAADLKGSLAGKKLDAFADMLKSGDYYVNVHSDKYPDGELRGQIK